jgi:hypothetical protein
MGKWDCSPKGRLMEYPPEDARVTIEGVAIAREVAIEDGEIETTSGCSEPMIDIHELAEQAVHVWPIDAIEEALRREAALILPAGVRTRRFTARLPRYVVAALQCLAEENGESADALLTRELHGLAYAHRERHGSVDRGFAEAVNWPFPEDGPQGRRSRVSSFESRRHVQP